MTTLLSLAIAELRLQLCRGGPHGPSVAEMMNCKRCAVVLVWEMEQKKGPTQRWHANCPDCLCPFPDEAAE